MSRVYTFHETVIGNLHVMNGLPCEDSSSSFTSEDGRYHIALVADGHGSKLCFRSEYGSRFATEVAKKCLCRFAESVLLSDQVEERFYTDIFSNPRYCQQTMKRLTDSIIAKWNDRVFEHYSSNPPFNNEGGENVSEFVGLKDFVHIYGTTLICALQLPKCMVLLQQGDGRCNVFYDDGSVNQPIPWDLRCEGTSTTSMCDADAVNRIRSCVLDLTDKQVIACYLGCDGIEDAYRDTYEELGGSHVLMGGVFAFYKDLTCQLIRRGEVGFEEFLHSMLSEFTENGRFSRTGSGDDISVAGIVNIEAVKPFVEKYEYEVKIYALEEKLFWKEDALRGKIRKREILKKRMEEYKAAFCEAEKMYQILERNRDDLNEQREKQYICVEQARKELEKYKTDSQPEREQMTDQFEREDAEKQILFSGLSNDYYQKRLNLEIIQNILNEYNIKIQEIEDAMDVCLKNTTILEDRYNEAQTAYDEYNEKYQAIDKERISLQNELNALQ